MMPKELPGYVRSLPSSLIRAAPAQLLGRRAACYWENGLVLAF